MVSVCGVCVGIYAIVVVELMKGPINTKTNAIECGNNDLLLWNYIWNLADRNEGYIFAAMVMSSINQIFLIKNSHNESLYKSVNPFYSLHFTLFHSSIPHPSPSTHILQIH